MIHYTCDVCGVAMPADYVRPKTANGSNLLNACHVHDVCDGCLAASRDLNVAEILLSAWRGLKKPKEVKPTQKPVNREPSKPMDLASEKRAILDRLRRFREAHKPGCLDAVAAKAGSRFTPEHLRDVLLGNAVMPIDDWRKVNRALDKLGFEMEVEVVGG